MNSVDVDLPLCAAWKTSGVTVAGSEDGIPGDALDELRGPVGLHAARDGTFYVVDKWNHRVMKYVPNGSRHGTQIGDGRGNGSRQLFYPNAVVVDEATNAVYISDYDNQRIQLWPDGGMSARVETVLGQLTTNNSAIGDFSQANDIQLDPRSNDTLYTLETESSRVSKWKLRAKYRESSFRVYSLAYGMHVDAQHNVYVVELVFKEVFKWTKGKYAPATNQSTSRLKRPTAVVVDSDGQMFIADSENHRIVRWELNAPEGICIVGCSATSANRDDQLSEPKDLTFDWKGNLLVADTENNRVQRFDLLINTSCGKCRTVRSPLFLHAELN